MSLFAWMAGSISRVVYEGELWESKQAVLFRESVREVLSDKEYELFRMRFIEDLTYKQIG